MACYHPLTAFRSLSQGGRIVFSKPAPFAPELKLPCGQCHGCRLDRSRVWAVRCVHEAQLYERNCFITLTFDSDHVPASGSLEKDTLQRFFKRLRKRYGAGIRYFACGEYGERFGRPHYHACIFNFDFDDKVLWSNWDNNRLYYSASLADLWPYGFSTVGDLTFNSAAYVARYVMKKVTGDASNFIQEDGSPGHYVVVDGSTGEMLSLAPEFVLMSRRPGIGRVWFDKYMSDVYPEGVVVSRGVKMKAPRYYDKLYETYSALGFAELKRERKKAALRGAVDQTPERLLVREQVSLASISMLKRSFENET